MNGWIFLLTLVVDGQIQNYHYRHADGYGCESMLMSQTESAVAAGHIVLQAECVPVQAAWKLEE